MDTLTNREYLLVVVDECLLELNRQARIVALFVFMAQVVWIWGQ